MGLLLTAIAFGCAFGVVLACADTASAKSLPRVFQARYHRQVCGTPAPGFAHCDAEVVTDAEGTPEASSGYSGYSPSELRSAYDLTTASEQDGGGETIALIDAYNDPDAESNLATYRSEFGLPACTTANGCFKKVNQTGGTSKYPEPPKPKEGVEWSEEMSVDIDMVSAVCPNCHIILVEAENPSVENLGAAADEAAALGATQISNSYGVAEFSGETSDDTYYDHPGIAVTAAAGDTGDEVEFPAASQYVTAVGGTTLTKDEASARGWSETVWEDTGSGCSQYIPKPSWQKDSGCSKRTDNDVAADANPDTGVAVYDGFEEKGWLEFGGTSVATPIIASTYALIGPTAATDYGEYAYLHPSWFNNVTSGKDGRCSPASYLCEAGPGYNGPTGIGTPDGISHPPIVSTGAASTVGTSTATIEGTVNPNGEATTYQFDYGTTTSYGSYSPVEPFSVGSGSTALQESASLTGLFPDKTYYYRIQATNSFGTTYGSEGTFTTSASGGSVSTSPQGTWVGTYGHSGYDLAAWEGGNDVVSMPGVSVNLLQGTRYVWASDTADVRALENSSGTSRTAATYYSSEKIEVQLKFSSAYDGNLELYAVDWDHLGRAETIEAGGQTASLSDFGEGAWVTFAIDQEAGSTLTITVTNTGPVNAVLSGIFLGGSGTPPAPPSPVTYPSAPQGTWVGTYGHSGYDLAAWEGGNDVVSMPGVSVNLLQGTRYVWASDTADVRALENSSGTSRTAATYYSSEKIEVQLKFSSAYDGNLELYAVDWDHLGRAETIEAGGQTASLSDFGEGAWVTFAIDQEAGSTLTITVTNTGPVNAVLSGIFLGGSGTPPAPPSPVTYPSAPQGTWVGTYGHSGYDLAAWEGGNDVVSMPGVSVNLLQGTRYVWASDTADVRALENSSGTSRTAATYYSSEKIEVQLKFSSAYDGNLELYAVDWDHLGRAETIEAGGQTASLSDFGEGAWVTFAIDQEAGSTLTITVTNTGPVNAVLSGIFLGGSGTPPAPPSPVTYPSAPQGTWVGTYGHSGYDLAAWEGGNDVVSMPGVSVNLLQGTRYVWASDTADVRALENSSGTSRTAATYYSSEKIEVQLKFSSAYDGNLELYAVDWDHLGRAETIEAGGQTASLSDFGEGAWVTFAIDQEAGSTLTITVTNTGPVNAVLSGIFLG